MRKTMTLEQFLAWEERQELRFAFDGFQPVAMTGETAAHSAIQANLVAALVTGLRGKPRRVHGGELKIEVAGRIRYPDAFVVCTPVQPRDKVVADPSVIFEILSPSRKDTDMIRRNAEYRATPSVQRHVMLRQAHAGALVFARKGEDWVADRLAGLEAVLRMPEIGIEAPVAEIYADVELTGEPAEG